MRKTRRILLLALVLSAAAVAVVYRDQRARQAREAPAPPAALAQNIEAASKDWVYYKGDGDRPVLEVRAREMEQVAGTSPVLRLKQVDLRLYKKDGKKYDHVQSASAEFSQADASLYAEGEVTITLAVPDDATDAQAIPRERLLSIITSGVHFGATGKAETEKPARFEFDLGSGQAVGASYDPQERDLRLHRDVKLDWVGRDKTRPPMHIEADSLVYREAESKVHLLDHSVFERKTLKMTGGQAVVTLVDGAVRNVEAAKASGTDQQPRRKLDFSADVLKLDLNEHSEIEKVLGEGTSRVNVRTPTGDTAVNSDRVWMDFSTDGGESTLQQALAQGHSELRSRPVTSTGTERLLHSEAILAKMRAGGEELEMVETQSPGVLDLLPLTPGQPKRRLEATRMWLDYGPRNIMERFRAVETKTRSERPAEAGKPAPPPALTWSHDLIARFDPKSGAMTAMEQTTDFRYEEGPQKATAQKATLDQMTQRIVLTGAARAWDTSGQVTAKTITMEQDTGRMTAEGDVISTREPEGKTADASKGGLLTPGEPLHGKAARMTMSDRNRVIVHEGGPQGKAVVWQGANRIQGAKVTINRAERNLLAEGDVTSLLADESAGKDKAVMTTVKASKLNYTEAEHLAHYTGGVKLARPGLDVRSTEMRAWLPQEGSGLDRLFADGAVNTTQTRPGGWRKGQSEHAEYYTEGQKVVLTGGNPVMTDSVKGATRGEKLTYSGMDDSLLVEGAVNQPAASRIRRN